MRGLYRALALSLGTVLMASVLTGCGGGSDGKRIVRIGHNQATDHPTHVALLEFESYVESKLGDRYNVEVYPSMDDPAITGPIFDSTKKAGFEAVTWIDAGTRNFYTVSTPINSPADLKGLKIRVQQSPTNVEMMRLLGGSATPMGFGEVYTALQSKIIDGAENNEMALTSNGHGDVCKFYSYDMHQMIPDILIGNCAFLDGLSPEDRAVFEEGFQVVNQVERGGGKEQG